MKRSVKGKEIWREGGERGEKGENKNRRKKTVREGE